MWRKYSECSHAPDSTNNAALKRAKLGPDDIDNNSCRIWLHLTSSHTLSIVDAIGADWLGHSLIQAFKASSANGMTRLEPFDPILNILINKICHPICIHQQGCTQQTCRYLGIIISFVQWILINIGRPYWHCTDVSTLRTREEAECSGVRSKCVLFEDSKNIRGHNCF